MAANGSGPSRNISDLTLDELMQKYDDQITEFFNMRERGPVELENWERHSAQIFNTQEQLFEAMALKIEKFQMILEVQRDAFKQLATRDNYWGDHLPTLNIKLQQAQDHAELLSDCIHTTNSYINYFRHFSVILLPHL